MKILVRAIAINYVLSMIGSMFFIPSFTIDPSQGMTLVDGLIYAWGLFFIFGSLFWGVYMLYHWGVSTFSKRSWKVAWFIVILVGIPVGFIGPLVYYVVVYEFKKGGLVKTGS